MQYVTIRLKPGEFARAPSAKNGSKDELLMRIMAAFFGSREQFLRNHPNHIVSMTGLAVGFPVPENFFINVDIPTFVKRPEFPFIKEITAFGHHIRFLLRRFGHKRGQHIQPARTGLGFDPVNEGLDFCMADELQHIDPQDRRKRRAIGQILVDVHDFGGDG